MSADQTEVLNLARTRAEKRIDAAIGELHKAAAKIGTEHDLPDNISGHSVAELLGRISFVPSVGRDLRRALGQAMAKQELEQAMFRTPVAPPVKRVPEQAAKPAGVPHSTDLANLSGITVQVVKALKAAGLHSVGDVINVPDEHLLKISGLAERTVAQLRGAIAKVAT